MKERKLIICRGIQGSGKSTWAKQWCHESPEHRVRFNNDDIRNMLGDYWVPSREKLVTEAKANMITFALIKGYDVVVDNMNLNPTAHNPKNRIPTPYLDKEGKVERRRKRRAYGSQGWKGWGGEIYFKKYGEIMMDVVDKKKARREAKKHIENELQDQL